MTTTKATTERKAQRKALLKAIFYSTDAEIVAYGRTNMNNLLKRLQEEEAAEAI